MSTANVPPPVDVPEHALDDAGHDLAGHEPGLAAMLRRYLELHKEKQDLEAQTRKVSGEKCALEDKLAEQLGVLGFQNVKVDGYTVSRRKETYVALVPETKHQAMAMLEEMGCGELLTVNHPALRSRIKEWIEQNTMPEQFAPMVKVTEAYGLTVKKSTKEG